MRLKQVVFDHFLSGFDRIYERRSEEVAWLAAAGYSGVYFIGRKKHDHCST